MNSIYESLNLLSATITRYQAEAAILCAGDFNRSLFRNNQGDKKFQSFCKSAGLSPAVGTNEEPTYHGYNGSTSRIVYVLMHEESCQLFGVKEDDLKIKFHVCKEDNISIISTHDAIYFELEIGNNIYASGLEVSLIPSVQLKNKVLCWKEADTELYQTTLESLLEQNFQFWDSSECMQILALY